MFAVLARFSLISAALCLLLVTSAEAKKTRRGNRRVIAVFPVTTEPGASKALADTLERTLQRTGDDHADVLTAREIDKRLRGSAAAAARRCGAEPTCLRALGKRLKVDGVLLSTAKPDREGLVVVVTALETRAETPRRVAFSFVTQAELDAALKANEQSIFGTGPEPTGEAMAGVDLVPLADPSDDVALEPPAGPSTAPTQPEATSDVDALPLEPPPVEEIAALPLPAIDEGSDEGPTRVTRSAERAEASWVSWKTYAGGGAVVAALAGGAYTVQRWLAINADAKRANERGAALAQSDAAELNRDNDPKYDQLTTIRIVCGVVGAAGAGLLVWDVLDEDAQASVAVTPGGAFGTVAVRF